jgi:hypothetical protein
MRKQYRILRKIATVPVTAGGSIAVDLPKTYDYETLFLRVYGGLQVTALATSVRAENPCQTVARVEVISDGKNTLHSAPFWFWSLGSYARNLLHSGARATTPASAVAVATYQVEAIGTVDFMVEDGDRPKDTNFRSAGLSLFQCRLTFGQAGDCFVGGTVAFSSMNVDIFSSELIEMPDEQGNFSSPVMLKKTSYQELVLPASNANQQVRLPAGNLIRGVLFRGAGAVTADEPATTVFNNFQLSSGTDVRLNVAAANLRAKNNADYGQITAGYYVADLLSKGSGVVNLTELWDVTGNAEPYAILDVTGGANNKMQAVVTEFIPLAA